jgi:Arc/MetJ-type ribon-helix-helix transcriptional regulator
MNKQRLSASVDADLIAAAERAVAAGRSESVSAWINDAMRKKAEEERRFRALDKFFAEYEARNGAITTEEMEAAQRWRRERAIVVRGGRAVGSRAKPTRRRGRRK